MWLVSGFKTAEFGAFFVNSRLERVLLETTEFVWALTRRARGKSCFDWCSLSFEVMRFLLRSLECAFVMPCKFFFKLSLIMTGLDLFLIKPKDDTLGTFSAALVTKA